MNWRNAVAAERLEDRTLLSGTGVLQGIAFFDTNPNGAYDAKDTPKQNAKVELFKDGATTAFATQTTGADGVYRFVGLDAGVYRIVETPPPPDTQFTYSNQDVQTPIQSQLYAATKIDIRTIEVTIPASVNVTYDTADFFARDKFGVYSFDLEQNPYDSNSDPYKTLGPGSVGQFPVTLSSSGQTFLTLCVDPTMDFQYGINQFPVQPLGIGGLPNSSPTPYHQGEIAYLFNHYGTQDLSTKDAVSLQFAIWEAAYDQTIDFTSGNFKNIVFDSGNPYQSADAPTTAEIIQRATELLSEAAGQTELAYYLLANQQPTVGGQQSILATGSYNFINDKQAIPQAEGMIDVEKLVRPVTPPGGGEGLTPGFWKTHSSYGPAGPERWSFTGYSPDDSFNAIFGVDYDNDPNTSGSPTLYQVLNTGGGGYKALGRHAVAALLNAADPYVDYLYTKSQIIAMVQNAYATQNFDAPKNLLEAQNQLGADLTTPETNGAPQPYTDADNPTGPIVPVGNSVEFQYVVTNSGTGSISNVVLVDDNETPSNPSDDFNPTPVTVTFNSQQYNVGDLNHDNLLDPGEQWLYTWTKVVTVGQHTNIGTVTGTDVKTGNSLKDTDAANWYGETTPPEIDIEKYVKLTQSGGGGSTGGEGLTPGYWKQSQHFSDWVGYTQTQSYNTVFGVNNPDNPTLLGALQAGGGGYIALGRHSVAALLNASNPNISYAYTTAQIIAMVQNAYATGDFETAKNLLAAENEKGADLSPNSTFGSTTTTTSTSYGDDADTAPGLIVSTGSSVTFTYVVTNPGPESLTNVVVTDDNQTPTNTADDVNPAPVYATGSTTINVGDVNQNNKLDPGETWLYTYTPTAPVTAGQHTNVGTATGTGAQTGLGVNATDVANWYGQDDTPPPAPVSKIDIEKFVQVVGPNSGNGGGEGLTPGFWKQSQHFYAWTGYTQNDSYNTVFGVTDPTAGLTLLQALQRGGGGNAALGRHAVAALLNASNPNIDYAYTVSQIIAMVRNAYATGNYETTKDLFAAENEKGADLTSGSTNGQTGGIGSDADSPTGPYALVGTQAVFTYLVTNPGQTALANVVVTDDRGTADPGDDFHPTFVSGDTNNNSYLDVGETWTYTATGTVQDGQNYNLGSVVGTPVSGGLPVGSPVTDQDYAYWYGVTDTEPLTGSISGTKYRDLTGNGLSSDDTPLSGVKIYLDTDNDGSLDTGEVSTTTGTDGTYRFIGLNPGTYVVREVVPAGYLRTAPAVNDFYQVTTASGVDKGGYDFANYQIDCKPSDITNVSFLINNTTTVTDLRGNTREGDVVRATFTVTTAEPRRVTLVSYTAPGATFDANTASQQRIYDIDTGVFTAGTYSLEVRIPSSFYQVDFVCGDAIDQLGPAGSNIFYTPQQRLISADNGGTRVMQADPSSLSGFVYVDANDDGFFGSERGIGGVTVTLTGTNSQGQAVSITRTTDSSGGYIFDNLLPSTSGYRITETQPTAYLDGKDTLGTAGGTVANDVFADILLGASSDGINYNFGERVTATLADLSGTVYLDANGNGTLDLGERGVQGVLIKLTGTDSLGNSVSKSTYTDSDGDYSFLNLAAGTYRIEEVQPAGYLDGADSLGSLGGVLGKRVGSDVIDDVFEQIAVNGVDGMWYNFGEKSPNSTGTAVHAGQTATIGFWRNKNGQALLLSLNGGPTSTNLGNWLATNFPKMFGSLAGANSLANKTNQQVAGAFQKWFAVKGQKLEAQVLAVAFAVYVTDSDLAGTVATKYGFEVTTTGLGAAYYNVGTSGRAFGVANYTKMKVLDILKATNTQTVKGLMYNGNSFLRNLANTVYDGINNAGDIG